MSGVILIVNRAFVREVLNTSGAVTLVIVCIFLSVRVLGFLREAAQGSLPVDSVLILVGLKTISYLDVILPLMLFIALLMVLGRWVRDNEMAVLAACGISLTNFLRPLLVLILVVGSLVALLSLYLTPTAVRKGFQIEQEFRDRSEIAGVIPGIFIETRRGRGVYFVEQFHRDEDRYENIFVYKSSFKREGVVVAKYGFKRVDELTGDEFLILKNGTRYEGNPGEPDYRIVDFETYALRIEHRHKLPPVLPVKARPTSIIYKDDHPELVGEFHWRVAKIVSVPILAIFALAFTMISSRQRRLANTIMAFVVYFLYTNALATSVGRLRSGKLDPDIGLWPIHAAATLIAVILLYRRSQNMTLLPRFRLRRT